MIAIVLARPEIPGNIGFIARTMACHGLLDLRIVGSPGMALHPDAVRTSSGEEAILYGAKEFMSLDEALADCQYALGFSRRVRDPGQRIMDLPEAAVLFGVHAGATPEIAPATSSGAAPAAHFGAAPAADSGAASGTTSGNAGQRLAMVFGRESQGLSREETFSCTHLVRIPLPGPLLSLNLSHAVAIALYAFFGGRPAAPRAGIQVGTQAVNPDVLPLGESEKVLSAVIARLMAGGQLKPAKAEAHMDYLRILWQRLQPNRREVEFLAGLLEKLAT